MKEEFQYLLIEKYLQGQATTAEKATLDAWRRENAQNQQQFQEMQTLHKAMQSMNFNLNADTDSEWRQLQRQLGATEAKVIPMKPRFSVLRIAAIGLVLLLTGWLIKSQFASNDLTDIAMEYVIDKGKTEVVTLSDGTIIHLNADSKLSVLEAFNEDQRRVRLSGEAYFDVAKNKAIPFIIESGKVTTTVVGTAFNIAAYPDNEEVAIHVTEGIVEFSASDETLRLTAQKAASFDSQTEKMIEMPFQAAASAWKEDSLVFKNKPFSFILKQLERRYNVQIKDKSNSGNRMLTETVESDDSIDNVLERLGLSAHLKVEKEGNGYVFYPK